MSCPQIQEVPIDRLMEFFETNEVVGQKIEQFASYSQIDDQSPQQQQETVITIQTQDGRVYQSRVPRAKIEPGRLEQVEAPEEEEL